MAIISETQFHEGYQECRDGQQIGIVFYHEQAADSCSRTGTLSINHGTLGGNDIDVANHLYNALVEIEADVDWNLKVENTICVKVDGIESPLEDDEDWESWEDEGPDEF